MRIAITYTDRAVARDQLVSVARVIERQIREDFAPLWVPKGFGVELFVVERVEGERRPRDYELYDAEIYIGRSTSQGRGRRELPRDGTDERGIASGVVHPDLQAALGEPWSRTLSHEVLELIADPTAELFARRPHPANPHHVALYPYEICDPVAGDGYEIDGWEVANFVTPLYFADLPEPVHTPTNFLNLSLARFGLRPRGYYSYFDARSGLPGEVCAPGNEPAMMLRLALGESRRRARARQALRASRAYAMEVGGLGSGAWSCDAGGEVRPAEEPGGRLDASRGSARSA